MNTADQHPETAVIRKRFLERCAETLQTLRGAVTQTVQDSPDYELLIRAGHQLKGTAGTFLLADLASLASQLESAARARAAAPVFFEILSQMETVASQNWNTVLQNRNVRQSGGLGNPRVLYLGLGDDLTESAFATLERESCEIVRVDCVDASWDELSIASTCSLWVIDLDTLGDGVREILSCLAPASLARPAQALLLTSRPEQDRGFLPTLGTHTSVMKKPFPLVQFLTSVRVHSQTGLER